MIKYVAKAVEKLLVPIVILNIAAIGAVFYNQGKVDAVKEIELAKATEEVIEA